MSVTLRTAVGGQDIKPESWYRNERPCGACRAEVLRRVERAGVAYIDVKHPDSCLEGRAALARADAIQSRRKPRSAQPSPRSAS